MEGHGGVNEECVCILDEGVSMIGMFVSIVATCGGILEGPGSMVSEFTVIMGD